jgi:hypothetical protein
MNQETPVLSALWAAGAGIGGGLAAGALVTVLALPWISSADRVIFWMLVIIGAVVAVLCSIAYFTQPARRRGRGATS